MISAPHKKRYYQLDLLRFICQYAIMLGHYILYAKSAIGHRSPAVSGLPPIGFEEIRWISASGISMGTMVAYIIISGYGFPTMFEGKPLRVIIRERFIRIWTTFFICCSITFAVATLVDGQPLTMGDYFFNASMLSVLIGSGALDTVYWFLGLELAFYFSTIVVMTLARPQQLKYWVLALLPLTFLPQGKFLDSTLHFEWVAAYLSGVTVYLITRSDTTSEKAWLCALFLACSGAAIYQSTGTIDDYFVGLQGDDFSTRKLMAGVSVLAVYAFILAAIFGRLEFLQIKWFRRLYGISYPLFLLHMACGLIVIDHWFTEDSKYLQLAALVVGLTAISYVIYEYVEPAFLNQIRRAAAQILPAKTQLAEHSK